MAVVLIHGWLESWHVFDRLIDLMPADVHLIGSDKAATALPSGHQPDTA